jgi:tRNA A37 threonylcarbamoyladenosine biosynthesis protein TsaE
MDDISNYQFGSSEFNKIARRLLERQNILIDSAAGTGKTTFAKKLKEVGKELGFKVLLTAVTGVAANNIKGTTISSKCRLGLYHLEDHEILEACSLDTELSSARIMVIDEISMMKVEEMRQINIACQAAKSDFTKPFGGITILCIGDYCQLEPIEISDDGAISVIDSVLVDLDYMSSLGFKKIVLNEIFRQTDPISLSFLSSLRKMIFSKTVDESVISEIYFFLQQNKSIGVSLYSNIKDVPLEQFNPDHYYYPEGNAPYTSLPIIYNHKYLVTRNVNGYYNGETITLTEENENHFLVETFKYKKIQGKDKDGNDAYLTKVDYIDARYLALLPIGDFTTRRVQGLTLSSGSIAKEFFSQNNKVRVVSQLGWLRTLYTALGRFTNLADVSIC